MKNRPTFGMFGLAVNDEGAFSLLELLVVVIILGILVFSAALSFADSRLQMSVTAAARQVEAALEQAKTAARQENVKYELTFYSSMASHPDTYEFRHNVGTENPSLPGTYTWNIVSVNRSVTQEIVIEESGNWYNQIGNGVHVVSEVTVTFEPMGTQMSITPVTITLQKGSETREVTIDAAGKITTVELVNP
ncbi:MAG: hypothetical protein A2Z14_14810 [Chloroflexi bacterium RBG_16_48_8]|nr:MAG: hypothetical protein A2Z74_02160 [Chloroflexi bacterium RBG_13_46_9]OGO15454.1 MAG: hypothetical protein A2Z14_14810 [Chloroflexi bacterium RBG_16_48_8]